MVNFSSSVCIVEIYSFHHSACKHAISTRLSAPVRDNEDKRSELSLSDETERYTKAPRRWRESSWDSKVVLSRVVFFAIYKIILSFIFLLYGRPLMFQYSLYKYMIELIVLEGKYDLDEKNVSENLVCFENTIICVNWNFIKQVFH